MITLIPLNIHVVFNIRAALQILQAAIHFINIRLTEDMSSRQHRDGPHSPMILGPLSSLSLVRASDKTLTTAVRLHDFPRCICVEKLPSTWNPGSCIADWLAYWSRYTYQNRIER